MSDSTQSNSSQHKSSQSDAPQGKTAGGAGRLLRALRPRALPVYAGWWVISAPFLAAVITVGSGQYAFGLLIEPLEQEFGWTRTQINVSLSFAAFGSMIAPLLGWIMDRRGARSILAASVGLIAVSYLLRPLMTELWHWYLLSFVQYMGFAGASILPAGRLVGIWFARSRGRVMGITLMGNNFGGMTFPPLTTLALGLSWHWAFGMSAWQGTYLLFGVIGVLLTAYAFLVVREFPTAEERRRAGQDDPATSASRSANDDAGGDTAGDTAGGAADSAGGDNAGGVSDSAAGDNAGGDASADGTDNAADADADNAAGGGTVELTGWTFGEAARTKAFYAVTLAMMLGTFTYTAVLTQVAAHLTEEGVSPAAAAISLSLLAGCGMCGKFLMGLLADRITARYALMIDLFGQSGFLVLLTFFAGATVALPLLAPDAALPLVWIFVPPFGFFLGAFGALFPLIVQDAFGIKHYGKIMGIMSITTGASSLLGPVISGLSFDYTGSYQFAFLLVAGLFFIGALALTQAGMPERRTAE